MEERGEAEYRPGYYGQERPELSGLAEDYLQQWDRTVFEEGYRFEPPPTICFSRMIGVGALKIAEILAPKIGYRVVDRELIEYIADRNRLPENTVAFFDERFPVSRFSQVAFLKSDYIKHLISAVCMLSTLTPAIIRGREAHLLLPREKVLALRFICSDEHRAARVARIMNISKTEAAGKLDKIDREQKDFFLQVFGVKEILPDEFDMIINCDYLIRTSFFREGV